MNLDFDIIVVDGGRAGSGYAAVLSGASSLNGAPSSNLSASQLRACRAAVDKKIYIATMKLDFDIIVVDGGRAGSCCATSLNVAPSLNLSASPLLAARVTATVDDKNTLLL